MSGVAWSYFNRFSNNVIVSLQDTILHHLQFPIFGGALASSGLNTNIMPKYFLLGLGLGIVHSLKLTRMDTSGWEILFEASGLNFEGLT